MEVVDAIEVQPHNKTENIEPQNKVTVKQSTSESTNRNTAVNQSKSTPAQTLEDSKEEQHIWPQLATCDKEIVKPTAEEQKVAKQIVAKKTKKKVKKNNKRIKSLPKALNSEEEKAVEFCAKRKRYEVSRLGSEEILLGCDEASGEAFLVSESEEPQISAAKQENNVMERRNKQEKIAEPTETIKKEAQAVSEEEAEAPPAAKRVKKSLKSSPRPEETKKSQRSKVDKPEQQKQKQQQIEQIQKAHVVGDAEELINNVPVTPPAIATKTRSAANSKQGTTTPANKPLSAQDDFYKKPFEYGWKRELVWRATPESGRERADVYFISPGGKKIRTRHDIPPLLEGDLTMEHFCWLREAVGMGPEFETVRNAKPNPNRTSIYAAVALAASAPTPVTGKRMPKPKGPKGASPPPEGWTPTRALKVNNAALNSRSGGFGSGFGGSNISPQAYNRSAANTGAATRSSSSKKNEMIVEGLKS